MTQPHYHLRGKQCTAAIAGKAIGSYFGASHKSPAKSPEGVQLPQSPRRLWTQEEITSIQDVFSGEVHERFINIESVRMKLPLLKTHATEKQILDKVRSLFRYTPVKKKHISTSVSTVFQLGN